MATQQPTCGGSPRGSVDTESSDPSSNVRHSFRIGSIGVVGSPSWFSNLGDKISSKMGKGAGEGPKKRGPKPDQKPAKNEKVERNRRAQRSHRERKERYIRNLEQEVQRLREAYTTVVKEKVTIMEENKQLHAILKQHAIDFPYLGQIQGGQPAAAAGGIPATQQGIAYLQQDHPYPSPPQMDFGVGGHTTTELVAQQITPEQYSQIAINLVLALEKRCADHIQRLATVSHQDPDYIQGHVLMVSCPPESHIAANPDQNWGLRTVDLDPEPLGTLFNMQVLDAERQRYLEGLDGELTPMAAWTKITTHPRFHEMTLQDFETLAKVLPRKVGCHGFGAVIEEVEIEEAMENIFAAKDGRA